MAGYDIPARKTIHNGVEYASTMEVRFAKLLDKNKIEFIYGVWVEVEIDGAKVFREIDFFLNRPIKPYWCSSFTNCFEIKGVLQPSDYKRRKALQEQGLETFIVTESILRYWETYDFLQHRMGKVKKKRSKTNSEIDF